MENEFGSIAHPGNVNEAENYKLSNFRFRLIAILTAFVLVFFLIGTQMIIMAMNPDSKIIQTEANRGEISGRKDIEDRRGKLLATNITVNALYAHPHEIIDKNKVVLELANIFPDLEIQFFRDKFQHHLYCEK